MSKSVSKKYGYLLIQCNPKWSIVANLTSLSGLVVDHFLVLVNILEVISFNKSLDLLFNGFNFCFEHLDVFDDLLYQVILRAEFDGFHRLHDLCLNLEDAFLLDLFDHFSVFL